MMSLGGSNNISSSAKFPFTPTQWQELEHQALIYKYMISGLPIPPDLLFSLKRSLDSSLSSSLLQLQPPHQPHIGWNCFQMGYGRKIDPEPGRCRRTDGKKWRCSKEAYPDSKYCERHMHRGRNRSRKPVEIITNSSPSKPIISQNSPSSLFSHSNTPTSLSSMTFVDTPPSYPFLHPHSSSSRPHGFGVSSSDERDRDYRYTYGMKEDIDEHPFFSESSGSVRDYSDSPTLSHLKQRTSDLGYPFLHLNDSSKAQQKQDQYFHIMDGDFHREMPMKPKRDDVKPHQVMHRFFDELPKDRDSWEDESSSYVGASTTQLSISTPNSSYDFFMAHDDK